MFRFFFLSMILLAACDRPGPAPPLPTRVTDRQTLSLGAQVYQTNCTRCHGAHAEGATNWQRPDAQGKYPPPPLNASGHAWHHPTDALKSFIKDGTGSSGGNMPAWRDKLGDQQIEAVIAWFQSLWPQEIYQAWAEMDAQARGERQ